VHSWDHFLWGYVAGYLMYLLTLRVSFVITGGKMVFRLIWTFYGHRTEICIPGGSLALASALFIQPWLHYILDGLTVLGEVKG
jgi:hypothetical protein